MLSETKVRFYQPGVASLRPDQGCVHNGSTANFPSRKVRKFSPSMIRKLRAFEARITEAKNVLRGQRRVTGERLK